MESLPNELLRKIFDRLDDETLKTGRLVNTRWHQVANYRMKRDFIIKFWSTRRLKKFLEVFQKNEDSSVNILEIRRFHFFEEVLRSKDSEKSLKDFCTEYGNLATGYEIGGVNDEEHDYDPYDYFYDESEHEYGEDTLESPTYHRNFFTDNLNLLLQNGDNIEELILTLPEYFGVDENSMVHPVAENLMVQPPAENLMVQPPAENLMVQPPAENSMIHPKALSNLQTLYIQYKRTPPLPLQSDVFCSMFLQIATQAPNLSAVTISKLPFTAIADIICCLGKTNPRIGFKLQIEISSSDGDLSQLQQLNRTPLRIIEMDITAVNFKAGPDVEEMLIRLTSWISMSGKFLRKLNIYSFCNFSITLPPLPNLEHLTLRNVLLRKPRTQVFQFPRLKEFFIFEVVDATAYSGAIFPVVKSARLLFQNKEDADLWPVIIPNVENLDLIVTADDSLHGIFKFSKLVKLKICIRTPSRSPSTKHWDELTADAESIPDNSVCTIPLDIPTSAEPTNALGFQNLTRLRHLEFTTGSSDCWKAIVYCSRTGQLRRLKNLVFEYDHYYSSEYCTTLEQFHDVVDLNAHFDYDDDVGFGYGCRLDDDDYVDDVYDDYFPDNYLN